MINNKLLIAHLLGFQFVSIGHEGTPSETDFQRKHKDWLDKVELDEVGNYFVNVEKDIWYREDEVDFERDLNWLNRAAERLYEQAGVDVVVGSRAAIAQDLTGTRVLVEPVFVTPDVSRQQAMLRVLVKAAILTDTVAV